MSSLLLFALGCARLLSAWLPAPPPGVPTAITEREDRILLGTERGLYREEPSGWDLVLTRGGVRDLAQTPRGTLIATAAGLYEWPAGASEPRALPLGAGARVRSVAANALGAAWVASEVGLFARTVEGRGFQRESGIPAGEVRAVHALEREVWVATRGTLWHGGRSRVFEPRLRGLETGWWELQGAARIPSGVVLAVPRGLWHLRHVPGRERQARAIPLGLGQLRGVARTRERLWVASERGVHTLDLEALTASPSRVGPDIEALDVELASRGLLVATPRGITVLPVTASATAGFALERTGSPAPDVRTVQRAVLRYLDLAPGRIAELETRARRAAWYPELRASLAADRDRTRDEDHDQTFSSGGVRHLFDRRAQSDSSRGIDIQLVWDLGKIADPQDALAVSRERRQLIELRDQVLERVNRLYFERLRVLARLEALPPGPGSERVEAELRVLELAAHLDAWTGGVFSRLVSDSPPKHGRP